MGIHVAVVFLVYFVTQWNLTAQVYMTSQECQNVQDSVKEVFLACGVNIAAEYHTDELADNSSAMVEWLMDIKTKARSKRMLSKCISKSLDNIQL